MDEQGSALWEFRSLKDLEKFCGSFKKIW